MSRKVTSEVVSAFLASRTRTVANTRTDGSTLYLHGNAIAQRREDGVVWVTLAGWDTPTTRERLNGLPGVRVSTKRGQAYLNGQPWDGSWTRVN